MKTLATIRAQQERKDYVAQLAVEWNALCALFAVTQSQTVLAVVHRRIKEIAPMIGK